MDRQINYFRKEDITKTVIAISINILHDLKRRGFKIFCIRSLQLYQARSYLINLVHGDKILSDKSCKIFLPRSCMFVRARSQHILELYLVRSCLISLVRSCRVHHKRSCKICQARSHQIERICNDLARSWILLFQKKMQEFFLGHTHTTHTHTTHIPYLLDQ